MKLDCWDLRADSLTEARQVFEYRRPCHAERISINVLVHIEDLTSKQVRWAVEHLFVDYAGNSNNPGAQNWLHRGSECKEVSQALGPSGYQASGKGRAGLT